MSSRLLIAVNSDTVAAAARNALTAFLQGKGWQVWHWFDDLWLAVSADDVTVDDLSAEIRALPGFGNLATGYIVMKCVGDTSYNGWAQPESWVWMRENWGKPR